MNSTQNLENACAGYWNAGVIEWRSRHHLAWRSTDIAWKSSKWPFPALMQPTKTDTVSPLAPALVPPDSDPSQRQGQS